MVTTTDKTDQANSITLTHGSDRRRKQSSMYPATSGGYAVQLSINDQSSHLGRLVHAASRLASASRLVQCGFLSAGLAVLLCSSALAQVPAVVATSPLVLNGTFTAGPAVTDACGDVYVFESGGNSGVVEYQAGTGKVTTVATNTQQYIPLPGRAALYMDRAKANLYFPDFANFYTTAFAQVPIVNCVPGAVNNNFGNNVGSLPNPIYYYGTANDVTGDAAGDVFFTTTQQDTTDIFEEVYASGSYTPTEVLSNWPNQINYIASDAAGNIYFSAADSSYTITSNIYDVSNKIYLLAAGYQSAPTTFASGFNNIVGLSFDAAGNLDVADSNVNSIATNTTPPTSVLSAIYEIPLVSGSLNAGDRFALASAGVSFKVAVDALNNIFLSDGSGLTELKSSSAVAPSTALGATAGTFPVNYIFNASVTPTNITTVTGVAASTVFTPTMGGCATGTTYTPATPPASTTSTCTETVSFTPATAGLATGALLFTSSSGTVTTDLSGIGEGAQATVDPGTVVPLTATTMAPAGVSVDNLGNVFVTDSSADTLTEFPAGSATGTVIPTGTLTLNNPQGVAVDALGDVFIADAGNNRVVEVPALNGALMGASAFALSPSLSNPTGVAVDLQGDLLIADTGHNNLLFVPNVAGALDFAAATSNGTTLDTPTAVTVDLDGNVFLAEAGAKNDVLEFAAPFGTSAQAKVASGLDDPTALTTDASGSLFIVNRGTSSIVRLPKLSGTFESQTLAGSTVANPYGAAADAFGNLYVTDSTDNVVAEVQRVTGSLQFGGWNVGTTSTPLSGTVNSSGTLPLTLSSPSYQASGQTTAGFNITTDGCAGQTVAVGGSCAITATFTPPMTELNAEETLTLQSNASNGSQQIDLVGTGANEKPSTLSIIITGPTPLTADAPVTLTATIGTGSSTIAPGGSVKFYVNGTQVGTVAVSNNQATLTLKNGLPAGNAVNVSATYTGDVINYSGSTTSTTVVVNALSDSISLTAVGPAAYTNPVSATDLATNPTGPQITLTATVTFSNSIIPNGTVTFFSGSTVLGVTSLSASAGNTYTASLITTALRAGTSNLVENDSYLTTYNDVYAVYSADTAYAEAASNMVPITVVGANPTANLANPNTTGATFSVTPLTSTITVPAGQSTGSTTVSFISYGGWTGYLNFTCSGLPANAQCAPFPGAPLVTYSTVGALEPTTTDTFIINTNVAPLVPTASSTVWWMGGLSGLCLLILRRRAQRFGSLPARGLLSLTLVALLGGMSAAVLSGCSTSGTSSSSYLTPKGTYTVNVHVNAAQLIGTSGTTAPNDINTPSFQVTLVVQ
jgi:hypothetical protein